MQLWFYTSSDQIGVTVGILGGHDDYRFIWPLKTIVTVELIDLTGRLEPISQRQKRHLAYQRHNAVCMVEEEVKN